MPVPTYAMVVDGVLRKPATNAVIEQGANLYWSLINSGRLALLCGPDEEKVDWFLRTNGFNKHVHLIPEDLSWSPSVSGRRLQQIRILRSSQAHVQFVIEPDPTIASELFKESIPVMLYLHPVFTNPAFRPGYKSEATPWEDLTREVNYQIAAKAAHAYDHEAVE